VAPVWFVAAGLVISLLVLAAILANRTIRRIEKQHPPLAELIDVDGTGLHVRITGDRSRPAILVLHGAASNLEEPHSALAENFADEHVIWLDRPGMGWSERPAGPWSPRHEADLIVRLLDALDLDQVSVVGHSWGGAIGMALAIHHPARITGLVLIGPALSAWIGKAAWFNHVTFWPVFGSVMTRLVVPLIGERQLRQGAVSAFHPEPVPEDYSARGRLPLLLRETVWRANADDMRSVNQHLETLETEYASLAQPTVMLAGKGDTVVWTHRHAGCVSRRMANAELRLIPGSGHNLHHHHPQAVLDAVRDVRNDARTGPELPISVETAQATA
jgi:pimeloyl-ACP methyl ester carboxylesterase